MNVSHEIELLVQEIHRLGNKSKDDVFSYFILKYFGKAE